MTRDLPTDPVLPDPVTPIVSDTLTPLSDAPDSPTPDSPAPAPGLPADLLGPAPDSGSPAPAPSPKAAATQAGSPSGSLSGSLSGALSEPPAEGTGDAPVQAAALQGSTGFWNDRDAWIRSLEETAGEPDGEPGLPDGAIRVADHAGLMAALEAATGGETIVLADGDYGRVELTQRFAETVTLRAESLHGARITSLRVEGAVKMTIDGMFFDYDAEPGDVLYKSVFSINEATDVVLRNSLFEGGIADKPGTAADGYPTGRGLRVGDSSGVVIEDNEFRSFWKAMNVAKCVDLAVRGNEFHDIRSDGFNLVASSRVLIEDNHFHDFRSNLETGDHPDMIQFWSTAGDWQPGDITIRNNYLDIGQGSAAQGIFIAHNAQSRAAHGEDLAFTNITITGNVIIGRHVNGITLGRTEGAVVSNNVLLTPPEAPGKIPRIAIDSTSTDVVMRDNMGPNFRSWTAFPEEWDTGGNIGIQSDSPHLPDFVGTIFFNPMSGIAGHPENLLMLPDSAAALAGAGSALLRYDPTPAALTALVRPGTGAHLDEIVFDGSYSAGPGGTAGLRHDWDFGDGTTASGAVIRHVYAAPGVYTATLTVTGPDGHRDVTRVITEIRGPDLLSYAGEGAGLTLHAAGETVEIDDPDLVRDAGGGLRFDADTRIVLDAVPQALAGAEGMSFSARLTAEAAGTVIGAKFAFNVMIDNAGELEVYMTGQPGGNAVTSGAGLLDGRAHDIGVVFDGRAGTLTLSVDGREMLVTETGLAALPADLDTAMKLGAQKSGNGFAGVIERLDLDVDAALYSGGGAETPQRTPEVADGRLEVGTLEVRQPDAETWHRVEFDEAIPDARVVMGPLGGAGGHPAVLRVRNVTDQGFEFQIDEWDYLDGRHVVESVSWLAMSAGTHVLADGLTISAGRGATGADWLAEVALSGFGAAPTVLAQVSSATGGQALTARVSGVGADGFDLRLQDQQAGAGAPAAETFDWIALEQGAGDWQRAVLEADHRWQTVDPGPDAPAAVLAGMQTAGDSDPAALRLRLTGDGLRLRVEEETSADRETAHGIETVHLLALEAGSYDLFA